ncbi:DUF1365 domain-containing protein [Streptomyces sp. NPDC048156]|uniref:DUF1365 domain-containing protein n=1 Tax=Streptomyces sp. NPDC048156 TaxID=3365502 RepID=UPI00371DFEC7
MPTPALYPCTVTHVRTAPKRHTLHHRTCLWLIDVDHPPQIPTVLRPLARFRARDHFGGDEPTLRAGLEKFLTAHAVAPPRGKVVMLAQARVLGYVFNPLSLYWCYDPQGELLYVVAEVHNTYGERHCYLLRTDAAGRASVDKEFYVSPFFPVDGHYRMRLPPPGERLDVAVHLERADGRPFTATVRGSRRDATLKGLVRAAVRYPWSTLAVSAAIRVHGIRLYLKGLPVEPRPHQRAQKGMK